MKAYYRHRIEALKIVGYVQAALGQFAEIAPDRRNGVEPQTARIIFAWLV